MKLRDIIEITKSEKDLLTFYTSWDMDENGKVYPVFETNFNLDDEVEVVYYWYHHGNLSIKPARINRDIILGHDYKAFLKISDQFDYAPMEYFPIEASVIVNGTPIGRLNIFRNERVFSCITYSECECG